MPSARRLAVATALAGIVLLGAAPTAPAAPRGGWTRAGTHALRAGTPALRLRRFASLSLDRSALASGLRTSGAVSLPDPGGTLRRFTLHRTHVMAPGLAAAHPDIATWAGSAVGDPATTVALDLGPLGLHASVRDAGGAWYVDPYLRRSQEVYASYYGRDAIRTPGTFVERGAPEGAARLSLVQDLSTGPTLHTYRLALASDPSYAAYFGSDGVTAAKVALMARVDQVYEQDLSIHMTLIATNDALNFDTAKKMTDAGYTSATPSCTDQVLDQNQAVIDHAIGSGSYDIGHLVLGADGGGLADLGVVGEAGSKAKGCTGIPDPVGDAFAIDYVAHEMGHEFGADHTWDGIGGGCTTDERSGSTAVEPGSGSSIMSYAGICDDDDLQAHSDPYFSERSQDQIDAYVGASLAHAGAATPTGDSAPAVSAPASFTIPVRTPFTLTGSATDADGDPLSYLWEQDDPGGSTGLALHDPVKTDGPLFRQFGAQAVADENQATGDPSRTFPDEAQVAAGDTDAATGSCADLDCFSEWLPTAAYAGPMHFRLTARDGRGGVASARTTVALADGAGPFRVTSQAASETLDAGPPVTVTWDVAGTSAPPVSAANVRIALSADGGLTFPYALAASTPNDGSADVVLPRVATTHARIRVAAVGNVFFDVSHADVTVNVAPLAELAPAGSYAVAYSDPPSSAATITVSDDGAGSDLTVSDVAGLPPGVSLDEGAVTAHGATWSLGGAASGPPGASDVTFTVHDADGNATPVTVPVTVVAEDATATYTGDTSATGAPAAVRLAAAVAEVPDGTPGDLSLATVTFREGPGTLCGPVAVQDGSAACTAMLAPGDHDVVAAIGGRYTGSGAGHVRVTRPGAGTTGGPTPTPTPTPTPSPVAVNPLLCSAPLAITGLARHGGHVTVAGYAAGSLAGRRLAVLAGRRTVGHAVVGAGGRFAARLGTPSGRRVLLRVQAGPSRSAAVPLARSLTAAPAGAGRLRGRLTGAHHARRPLVLTRAVGCAGRPPVAARVRTDRSGRFTARVALPAPGTLAVVRVATARGRPRAAALPVLLSPATR